MFLSPPTKENKRQENETLHFSLNCFHSITTILRGRQFFHLNQSCSRTIGISEYVRFELNFKSIDQNAKAISQVV